MSELEDIVWTAYNLKKTKKQSCILNVYKITKLEFMTHDEAHDCFGSKGKTNAALTLGIL